MSAFRDTIKRVLTGIGLISLVRGLSRILFFIRPNVLFEILACRLLSKTTLIFYCEQHGHRQTIEEVILAIRAKYGNTYRIVILSAFTQGKSSNTQPYWTELHRIPPSACRYFSCHCLITPCVGFKREWSFPGATIVHFLVSLASLDGVYDDSHFDGLDYVFIIPVHLYGQPADMDPIMEIANRHGLRVIEDTAQAQGAKYNGRCVGALAHAAAHSFYPGKNLGAFGDGGGVTTDRPEIVDALRMLRNYGSRKKYHHEVAGFNSRLDELQAAFLRVRLKYLDAWNDRRRVLATNYQESLCRISDLKLPFVPVWAEPVWHLFVGQHDSRDDMLRSLAVEGVQAQIHYPIPAHRATMYRKFQYECPEVETLSNRVFSLPIGPQLCQSKQEKVISSLNAFLSQISN